MTKANSGLFQFHLRVRSDLPVTSSSLFFVSVSPGLKTFLISGRKVEPRSLCSCSQLGLAGPEDPRCPTSRVHTPDGAPAACTLPPESAKVSTHYLWDNDMKHQPRCWGSKYIFGIIAHQYRLRRNTELHVLPQPLWCSYFFLLSVRFCVCGCIRSFNKYFLFFLHARSLLLSCVEEMKKKMEL